MSGKGFSVNPQKRLLRPGQRPATVVSTSDARVHLADIPTDQAHFGDVPTFDGVGFRAMAPFALGGAPGIVVKGGTSAGVGPGSLKLDCGSASKSTGIDISFGGDGASQASEPAEA